MRQFHLIFYDPFVGIEPILEYISDKFSLTKLAIGNLFGNLTIQDQEIREKLEQEVISFYSIFEKIVLQNLQNNNILIPDYPRFLETKVEIDSLINRLSENNYSLNKIWYVRNTNLHKTIQQSLTMKGYCKTSEYLFNSSYKNAVENQRRQHDLIQQVDLEFKVNRLDCDSMLELTLLTQKQIDDIYLKIGIQ
jgi:uncharacterized protein (DUF1697 family)